jgi:septal ring factor EnvC (AmiA/AmiB activator)
MRKAMILMLLSAGLLLAGCDGMDMGGPASSGPKLSKGGSEDNGDAMYMGATAVQGDHENKQPSAVESALVWSEKYSKVAEQLVRVQQANRDLESEKRGLELQVGNLKNELDQTKDELADANEMLVAMRKELNNWKSRVLGLQAENRRALQAIIVSQKKILELLGGEVAPATASAKDGR